MKIRSILFNLLSITALTFPSSATDTRPNILFLLADDQRTDTVAAYGNPNIETPNLDSLVKEGFSFRRNYCMGSMHGAVCQPSRAMMMSGRSLYHIPMDLANTPILPELLRNAGYETFGTGKWHNDAPAFLRGFEYGEAVMLGGMADHEKVPVQDVTKDGKFTQERIGEKFSSELFANAAVDFLKKHDTEKPFFAYVAFTASHDPRNPPKEFRQKYYEKLPPLPPNFMPQHPFNNSALINRDENLAPWPRTEAIIRDQLAEYYGLITHLDGQIGRILATLKEEGLAGNTIIVYAADHGLAMGSHGLLGKQSLYEHSMGAPLIFAGPGIPKGVETHTLTYLMDIMPTLCNLAGVHPPQNIEGLDLRPAWEGKQPKLRDSIYLTYEDSQRAILDERWKLIRYPKIDHTTLFDLEIDPFELNNLANLPENSARIAQMSAEMETWQKRVDDKTPLQAQTLIEKTIDLAGHSREPDQWQPDWIVRKYFAPKSPTN